VDAMVKRMEPVLQAARRKGVLIVHAPSDTMKFYEETPQRRLAREVERMKPSVVRDLPSPPLPIDDSDGGCDTGESVYKAWTRQHAGLTIAPEDVVSDNGEEIYSLLKLRGRTDLFIMGVHTNMCILNRSFAIRQMTKWGMRCILVRDLTDAMYDPKDRPYVTHDEGTELVVRHIEQHWAPSVLSADLMKALR
jgi:nicotinamidase-related amidase